MNLNSFTIVCQAIVKTVVGPLLVILGFGVLGAIIGAVVSIAAGAIAGIAIVYVAFFRTLRKAKCGRCEMRKTLKPMLKYGVPLAASNVVGGILPLSFNSLIVVYGGSLYGDYLQATNFSVLLTFLTIPIITVLFPTFSKLNPEEEPELMKTVFASSVKYSAILVVPATMAMMILATPMINTLFGYLPSGEPKFAFAPLFLVLVVLGNLFAVFGNLSIGTFLAGLGETKLLMKQGLLTLVIGMPLAFTLVPSFGVVGGIIGILVASVPSMSWGLHWVWKRYKLTADFRASGKIFAASAIASAVTYLLLTVLAADDWVRLASGLIVFLVLYLISAPLIGAVNQTDVNNLRAMLSGLGVVSKILEIPLRFMEKTLKLRPKQD
jgi:O-antigen/teichoic acid export membrane protein